MHAPRHQDSTALHLWRQATQSQRPSSNAPNRSPHPLLQSVTTGTVLYTTERPSASDNHAVCGLFLHVPGMFLHVPGMFLAKDDGLCAHQMLPPARSSIRSYHDPHKAAARRLFVTFAATVARARVLIQHHHNNPLQAGRRQTARRHLQVSNLPTWQNRLPDRSGVFLSLLGLGPTNPDLAAAPGPARWWPVIGVQMVLPGCPGVQVRTWTGRASSKANHWRQWRCGRTVMLGCGDVTPHNHWRRGWWSSGQTKAGPGPVQ